MWYFMVYFVYGITKYTMKYHIQLLKYKIQRLDTGLDSQTRRFVESETLESKTGERCWAGSTFTTLPVYLGRDYHLQPSHCIAAL